MGKTARLTTHCNKEFIIKNSLNSRSGRWLRNKWFTKECAACKIPGWKLEKYSATTFKRHHGSMLEKNRQTHTSVQISEIPPSKGGFNPHGSTARKQQ